MRSLLDDPRLQPERRRTHMNGFIGVRMDTADRQRLEAYCDLKGCQISDATRHALKLLLSQDATPAPVEG